MDSREIEWFYGRLVKQLKDEAESEVNSKKLRQ